MSNHNIEQFETILRNTNRNGVENLIGKLLVPTDFYKAPASCSHYNAQEGGLLQHSLNTYEALTNKLSNPDSPLYNKVRIEKFSETSIAVIALLHDVYKIHRYTSYNKNQKTYDKSLIDDMRNIDPYKIKADSAGEFIWETVTGWQIDDKFPMGTTEKSIFLIQRYMPLKCEEAMAIKWINGPEPGKLKEFSMAIEKYPIVLAAYEANMEAMYLFS